MKCKKILIVSGNTVKVYSAVRRKERRPGTEAWQGGGKEDWRDIWQGPGINRLKDLAWTTKLMVAC